MPRGKYRRRRIERMVDRQLAEGRVERVHCPRCGTWVLELDEGQLIGVHDVDYRVLDRSLSIPEVFLEGEPFYAARDPWLGAVRGIAFKCPGCGVEQEWRRDTK